MMKSLRWIMIRTTKSIFAKRSTVSCSPFTSVAKNQFGSVDDNFSNDRLDKSPGENNTTREFTYFLLGVNRMTMASLARLALIKCIANMSASADVLALASADFDLSGIKKGSTITVKWRGKPVFIKHRTEEEITEAEQVPLAALVDPQTDQSRVKVPEWLIVVGVCTHLGCVPIPNAGEYKGWFCPCHGSHYDTSGRVRKGPAPLNMEIPPYTLSSDRVILG